MGVEAVEVQGVFLQAGMNLEGDRRRRLRQGIKGRQGNEDAVAHAPHLHQDLVRGLVNELAFQVTDHGAADGQRL